MSTRHKLAMLTIFCSFVLLYFGLTRPILTITMTSKVVSNLGSMEADVLNKTQSILATVKDLFQSGKSFVGFLILFFSIIVPVLKGGMLLTALTGKVSSPDRLVSWVRRLGKWSMADVMVVAIFIAYLSTRFEDSSVQKSLSVFGMVVNLELQNKLHSALQPGFYWFTAYCLLSLVSLELIKFEKPKE